MKTCELCPRQSKISKIFLGQPPKSLSLHCPHAPHLLAVHQNEAGLRFPSFRFSDSDFHQFRFFLKNQIKLEIKTMKPNDPQYAKSYKTNKDCIETITTRGEIFNAILQGKVNRSSHLNIYDIFKIYLISPKKHRAEFG